MDKYKYILLALIVALSLAVRVYKIDSVPPSLTWDEAAVGYNAWTIANFGRDEYGKFFPLYFQSFGEDKQPVHIYATALSVKLLGLSEFSTRLPSAIFGTLNVLLIFFLARILFASNLVGFLSSLFLAASPQNIHFSRFNHEANFALFFFMLGLLLFYKSLKRKDLLPLSILFFILSMISYHAAEIVVPPFIALLAILYYRNFRKNIANLAITAVLVIIFIFIGISQPRLLGTARFGQTVQGKVDIEETALFKQTGNLFLGRINLILNQYSRHFDPKFLFDSGDKNPRLSSQGAGEFYKIDALFLVTGFLFLILKRSKPGLVILAWAFLGPLPSSLVAEAPHAGRTAFMMGSWQIISALGFCTLTCTLKRFKVKWIVGALFLGLLLIFLGYFLRNFFYEFPKRYAIDWQYGMKQAVEYSKDHPEYPFVFMTNLRSQPYIFYLYYLQTPLYDYLNSVQYNKPEKRSNNLVSSYGRYYFDGFNFGVDLPNHEALYILTPSEYDGLMYRSDFNIKKVIYYPNGTNAYYIVSIKKNE